MVSKTLFSHYSLNHPSLLTAFTAHDYIHLCYILYDKTQRICVTSDLPDEVRESRSMQNYYDIISKRYNDNKYFKQLHKLLTAKKFRYKIQ